jgi:hypothetical protein
MSKFYGTVHGAGKTPATRRGHSSIVTYAASWDGAVRTEVYEKDGVAFARVSLSKWHGRGIERELYHGPINE